MDWSPPRNNVYMRPQQLLNMERKLSTLSTERRPQVTKLPKAAYKAHKVAKKISSYLELVDDCSSLLVEHFNIPRNLRSTGKSYLTHLAQVGKHRGLATMILTAKAGRLYVTRHLSGQPLMELNEHVKLTTD